MLSSKYLFSTVAILALVGCGSSHSDIDINENSTPVDLNGKVIDGYIKGAKVCIDANSNSICDKDEPTTTTDAQGNFNFKSSVKGSILAYGGIDLSTGLPFKGVLKAPQGSNNITPLTTLLDELIKSGKSKDEALNSISKILGIDKGMIEKDPVAELKDGNSKLLKANWKLEKTLEALANTKEEFSKVLEDFTKNLEKANSFTDLINNIVEDDKKKNSLKELISAIEEAELNSNNQQDFATLLEASKESIKDGKSFSKDNLLDGLKSCEINPDLDDSSFVDTPPNGGKNIPYFTVGESVSDIESAFNYARSFDTTVNNKKLSLPSQEIWNGMSQEDRALYILNRERVDRGLKPFEGVVAMNKALKDLKPQSPKTLADVAQGYTNLLYTQTTLGHNLDGTPTERIDRVSSIKGNKESIPYNESLYAEGNSYKLSSIPLVKAIYNWIYADEIVAEGKPWGHRAMCLMKISNDDFGVKGAEGLLAFGLKQGKDAKIYPNYFTSIVTMNAINPLSSFTGEYKKSRLCYGENSKDDRFKREKGLITDTKTSLIWQDLNLTKANLQEAKEYCQNLNFAGFDDWRLPKATELSAFYKDAIDAGVTPNLSQINITKMSADGGFVLTGEGAKKYGRAVASITNDFPETSTGDVRCVRGEAQSTGEEIASTGENLVVDSTKEVVIDNSQDLMFENNSKIGGRYNIEYGKIVCSSLELGGFTDWRLATPDELSTLHKNAKDEGVTLQYYTSYCTYEITNDGSENSAKAIRVQKSDDKYNIGDVVPYSGSAGIRCVRENSEQDKSVDTISPNRVQVEYTANDKIAIELKDEDQFISRTNIEINYDCDDSDRSNIKCKDFSLNFKGEPNSKLYSLNSLGKVDKELGVLDANGELTVDFKDADMSYSEGFNSTAGHFFGLVGEMVLIDEAGNISKVNGVWVEFYVP